MYHIASLIVTFWFSFCDTKYLSAMHCRYFFATSTTSLTRLLSKMPRTLAIVSTRHWIDHKAFSSLFMEVVHGRVASSGCDDCVGLEPAHQWPCDAFWKTVQKRSESNFQAAQKIKLYSTHTYFIGYLATACSREATGSIIH